MTWDEQGERVLRRGEWHEKESGTTYWPPGVRPSFVEAAEIDTEMQAELAPDVPSRDLPGFGDGYRIRSDDTWDRARRDYLAGDSCRTVCLRYGLAEGTLKHRARAEGWRKADAPDPEPLDPEGLDLSPQDEAPDRDALAAQAMARFVRAVRTGHSVDALRWQRVHAALTVPLPPPPPEPRPLSELELAVHRRMEEQRLDLLRRLAGLPVDWTGSDPSDPSDRFFSSAPNTAPDDAAETDAGPA